MYSDAKCQGRAAWAYSEAVKEKKKHSKKKKVYKISFSLGLMKRLPVAYARAAVAS